MSDRIRKTAAANATVIHKATWLAYAKKHGICSYCAPHRGENATRRKHDEKPKRKFHRRKP